MRIKIIGDNNCARATRHLLRMAGFAVTDFLPVEAITHAPHSGYAITIELAPATHPLNPSGKLSGGFPASAPDLATHEQTALGEASSSVGGASSRLSVRRGGNVAEGDRQGGTVVGSGAREQKGTQAEANVGIEEAARKGTQAEACASGGGRTFDAASGQSFGAGSGETCATGGGTARHIQFDSVDSLLEAAVLRHVSRLATGPVVVDRPGGLVHSERELRIVVPVSGDAKMDEAAAVAVEFGVLRGLLELTSPAFAKASAGMPAGSARGSAGVHAAFNTASASEYKTSATIPLIAPEALDRGACDPSVVSAGAAGTAGEQTSEMACAEADESAVAPGVRSEGGRKKWWLFGLALIGLAGPIAITATIALASIGVVGRLQASPGRAGAKFTPVSFALAHSLAAHAVGTHWAPGHAAGKFTPASVVSGHAAGAHLDLGDGLAKFMPVSSVPAYAIRTHLESLHAVGVHVAGGTSLRLNASLAAAEPQGQFSTGQGVRIFDGTYTLLIDPCKAQTKLYVSINQTANAQLVSGTSSKKIYVCSIHVVVAAATNIALVEGTGSVCATGTSGLGGFGGATAATGWNFAANGGIVLGSGEAAVGAEITTGDNLCMLNSGSGQVSGGISYVVQ